MAKRTNKQALKAQDDYVEDLTGALREDLDKLFGKVQRKIIGDVQRSLEFENGSAPQTVQTRKELLRIANEIKRTARDLGVDEIVNEFIKGFDGSLVYFDDILANISSVLKTPLKQVRTPEAVAVLNGVKLAAGQSIDTALEVMIGQAKRNALLRVGAVEFSDVVENLAKTFDRGVAEAETLGATAMSMFMRTNSDMQMREIEKAFPGATFRYTYLGPDDKFTRPFCDQLLAQTEKQPLTREEIDKLDNGQIPDVMTTGGGFNCRHSWIMAPDEVEPDEKEDEEIEPRRASLAPEARQELDAVDRRFTQRRQGLLSRLSSASGPERDGLERLLEALIDERLAALRAVVSVDNPSKVNARISGRPSLERRELIQAGLDAFESYVDAKLIGQGAIRIIPMNARSYYSLGSNEVYLRNAEDADRILVHELGHWLEDINAEVHRKAVEFLERRTTVDGVREPLIPLGVLFPGKGYDFSERVRRDKFKSAYTGKAYEITMPDGSINVVATEIVSIGLESLHKDPYQFAHEDPDFFDFIYNLLRGQ